MKVEVFADLVDGSQMSYQGVHWLMKYRLAALPQVKSYQ